MDFTFDIQGEQELEKALLALPTAIAAKALTEAMLAGAQKVADAVEAGAPTGETHDGRHIKDEIVVQQEPKPIGSAVEFYVGPSGKVAWRAKFNEFGTTVHEIIHKRKMVLADQPDSEIFGAKVIHPGQAPQPFMRNALAESGEEAIAAIRTKLTDGIQTAAASVKSKV
jgi:HK97 gp10 family phage protein